MFSYFPFCARILLVSKRTASIATVIDAGKDLPGSHTPTFAKELKYNPMSVILV